MIRVALVLLALLVRTAHCELAGFATDTAPTMAGTVYAIGKATAAAPESASRVWAGPDTTFDALTCTASQPAGTGNSWTVDVVVAGSGSNTFVPGGYSCAIHDAVQHCGDNSHATAWVQDGSIAFAVTTVGTPPAGTFLTCAVRVAGTFELHLEGILVTTTATAYGSFSVNVYDDFQAMQPVEGTFTTVASRLTCLANEDIDGGSVNVRVRHGTGPTFGWSNSPINCTMFGLAPADGTCPDTINTQALGGQDAVSFRLTPSGTMPAGLVIRCGLIYTQ